MSLLQGTQEEWQRVFYICAALNFLGLLVFLVLAEGEEQSWANIFKTKEILSKEINLNLAGEEETQDLCAQEKIESNI